jgi:hypothetical protein
MGDVLKIEDNDDVSVCFVVHSHIYAQPCQSVNVAEDIYTQSDNASWIQFESLSGPGAAHCLVRAWEFY